MKKYVIYLFLFMFLPLAAMAQSSMTDQQVMQFIVKEHNSGKSQSEIVTKLMLSCKTKRLLQLQSAQLPSSG